MDEKLRQPSRVLAVQGGVNFRDLGGYRSRNGKSVVWRKLLRCGHMSNLTKEDERHLAALPLARIHDFRNLREQQRFPSLIKEVPCHSDYKMTFGSTERFFALAMDGTVTEAKSRLLMEEAYTDVVDGLRAELGRFLKNIAAGGNETIVFHCMAGKDRTGVAAAVLLMALGVPESVIVEDYLLSVANVDVDWMLEMLVNDLQAKSVEGIRASAYRPFCTVFESYISAFLNQVKRSYRSSTHYLEAGLGLTPTETDTLQRMYLQD